jgi:hypothetical protein
MERTDVAGRIKLGKIGIRWMIVRVQEQGRICPGRQVSGSHMPNIDVEQSIAVDDQKAVGQLIQTSERRTGRTLRHAVVDEPHGTAEVASGEESLDLIGRMIDEYDDIFDAMGCERAELALQKRHAVNRDQRLGASVQPLGQPRAFAAREDHRLGQAPIS